MSKRDEKSYFESIGEGISTLAKGAKLTLSHLLNANDRRPQQGIQEEDYFDETSGIVTLEYPHESIPVPDNGRYRLHNEIEDCIVCDKCAKICPVNCIEIDTIKAGEEVGRASDGSPIRLYAGKFDIDMAKCCFCGLCTTVCPTECLTMTKAYDFSEYEVEKMTYHFSNLTPEEVSEKLQEAAKRDEEKAAKAAAAKEANTSSTPRPALPKIKPSVRPAVKPASSATAPDEKPKPNIRPNVKPSVKPSIKPSIKPKVQPKKEADANSEESEGKTLIPDDSKKPKPVYRPKPIVKRRTEDDSDADSEN